MIQNLEPLIEKITVDMNIDMNAIKNLFMAYTKKHQFPFHYFTPENAWKVIVAELGNDDSAIKSLLKTVKPRPKQAWEDLDI